VPSGSISGIQDVSSVQRLYQAGFDASWELDLWGGIRRSVEAS
jgi:multidrug efflux system outer membrane protein